MRRRFPRPGASIEHAYLAAVRDDLGKWADFRDLLP
jgi:hypothetical protein